MSTTAIRAKIHGGDPVTSDPEYSIDEVEFSNAVQSYKARTGRQFPSNREVLRIVKELGYQKIGWSA